MYYSIKIHAGGEDIRIICEMPNNLYQELQTQMIKCKHLFSYIGLNKSFKYSHLFLFYFLSKLFK